MKLNNRPTNRLRIKFSKTAFLDILKFAIKRACVYVCYHGYTAHSQQTYYFQISATFVWQDKSSEKISVSELIVTFCNLILMPSPDEIYRGVEIVVHSLVVAFETRLNTVTWNPCTMSRISQTNMVSKCIRIASTDILKLKKNLGGDPPNPAPLKKSRRRSPEPPLTRRENPTPLSSSPARAFGPRRNCAYAVQ